MVMYKKSELKKLIKYVFQNTYENIEILVPIRFTAVI